MSEMQHALAVDAVEPSDSFQLPLCGIEQVQLHLQAKRLVVRPLPPFPQQEPSETANPAEVAEELYRQAWEALQNHRLVGRVCQQVFPPSVELQLLSPVWERRPTPAEVSAMVQALLDAYAGVEPMVGNWFRRARREVVVEDSSVSSDVTVNARFWLESPSVHEQVQRKRAGEWLARLAKQALGLHLIVQLDVDADAQERAEQLRQELLAQQRQEVVEIARRERQAAEAKPPAADTARPDASSSWRGRRERDDEPIPELTIGKGEIHGPVTPMKDIADEMRSVVVEGRVFKLETRVLPSGRKLYQFNLTDEEDSITAKYFTNSPRQMEALDPLQSGSYVRVMGAVQFDPYQKELVLMIHAMRPAEPPRRTDTAVDKRVELHLHTPMSALDAVTPLQRLMAQAAEWGHPAIAVTDHGGVQAFPEAYELGQKYGIKVLLGVEAYVVDDGTPIVYRPAPIALDPTLEYVVFDTETTGLNAREDTLIEISGVKVKNGELVDSFTTLVDPERRLSAKITELTGISPDMLAGQPKLPEAMARFREFVGDAVLVAHNAEFDVGFLHQCAKRIGMEDWTQPVIDTLALARLLYPGEKNYRLKTLTNKFHIELVNHHRALADSEATAKLFLRMLRDLGERGIRDLQALNQLSGDIDMSRVRPFHATILVTNQTGLRNLYELVSLGHTRYLHRVPRLPRSELVRLREGLLIGSACQRGELVEAFLRGKSLEEIEEICEFYDFLEIQPPSHYENLVRDETVQSLQSICDMHKQIVELGKRLNKPVVATGDVHFLNPKDGVFREVFLQAQPGTQDARSASLFFRTTDEMLADFEHLEEQDRRAVVIDNPRAIADACEVVKPIPDDLYTPVIDGAEDEIRQLAYDKAKSWYGDPLPDLVEQRLQKELNSIINNGFAVIYLIAHKLVTKSLEDGYLVGSRGSVGSSLVATMTDITEVNPLPPHYRCPSCRHSEFITDGSVGSGFDLPAKDCPRCGASMLKDGQDIPFETFMGFNGDKVPDIDLNFSGEYQPRAHRYTEELFGKDHVFRAGTISAVAEKTAYGYVRKFAEERGLNLRSAEMDRLVEGCTGVKRTTGQHPGGQVVVPRHETIYHFTPVQYPADDKTTGTLTTHFDYHSGLERCLLKLDILGHDDPTVIRMLQDLTGVDPKSIPLDDPKVLELFRGTESLGVTPEEIRSATGTFAIPEFGTKFVRQMLEDTRPTTFSELVRISGLSHGTDVWLNNAQDLIRNGIATLSEVICARDDIMVYLIYKGLEPARAFKIMESIRKGKGVKEEDAAYMREHGVPDWYIESGRKIKYMFPKAHAAAYVLMAVRIAWFKVHHPLAFYATYFTVRADDFDVELMVRGKEAIRNRIEELEAKGNAASAKEKNLLTVLEVALEMTARGYRFLPIDLYQSHATRFQVVESEKALLPPFAAIPGVGESAATSLYEACQQGPFLSVEDLQARSKVSRAVIDILDALGCLKSLPETNQLSLF
ncbi:PolC-type DNA polymerase III [Alicyclobacillus shizuokensis]|uniref:PolC-type DNA polymerase III n=1 Tax=Alicyclobacillus shizuokensis TaxID=392014 RepID=UPI00082C31F7|nr:PolC-type DNA polymerase III [Alicyclobacillus shizuokensis]